VPNPDFDWVTALYACTPAKVFEQLRLDVQKDVETRNKLRPKGANYEFHLVERGETFTVISVNNYGDGKAEFTLTETGITIKDSLGRTFEACLTLNDKGECITKIEGKEYELWQLRKLALEDLFANRARQMP